MKAQVEGEGYVGARLELAPTTGRKSREQQAAKEAAELIVFADGAEEAGMICYARRARNVARETLWLVGELEAERSARRAMQEARDRALGLVTPK